jgi:hypothetical protein
MRKSKKQPNQDGPTATAKGAKPVREISSIACDPPRNVNHPNATLIQLTEARAMLHEAFYDLHAFFDDGYSDQDRKEAWLKAHACMAKARFLLELIEQRRSDEKKSIDDLMEEAREIDRLRPEYWQAVRRLLPPDPCAVVNVSKPN